MTRGSRVVGSFWAAAAVALAGAAVLDLPVFIEDTYSSIQINVGNPPKTYRLLFDTGSGPSWIVRSECANSTGCENGSSYHRVGYNAAESETYRYLGPHSEVDYLGGGISGDSVEDVFQAPVGSSHPSSWKQTFLSVNKNSWGFITADGMLGMAFNALSMPNTTTLMETLFAERLVDQPTFWLYYGTNTTESGPNPDGVLTLGGSREQRYVDGGVHFTPLRHSDPYGLWSTHLRTIFVTAAEKVTSLPFQGQDPATTAKEVKSDFKLTDGVATWDTGAGRITLPSDIVAGVYHALGWNMTKLLAGEERWTCDAYNASWSITFVLGNQDSAGDVTLTLHGDEMVSDQCMPPFDDSGRRSFSLMGAQFLEKYYTVWDYGSFDANRFQPRLGFGRLKKEYRPRSPV